MSAEADVLQGAVRVLDERGWCQQRYVDGEGRCCAEGALWTQPGFSFTTISNAIATLDYAVGGLTANWNDAPGRTVDEVKAALVAAADAAEADQ